jgi:hypothetical protein
MATSRDFMAEDKRLSLYFQLKEGQKADLEIISSAAIAWVETLRATAKALDPESDIRVELVDADESSLIFNTLIEWFEKHVESRLERLDRGGQRLPRTKKLALAFAIYVGTTGADRIIDALEGPDYTEEDRERAKRIEEKLDNDVAIQTARRKFYRTLEREPAVVGVGIREEPRSDPMFVIQSVDFPEAGGLWVLEEDGPKEQISQPVLEVTLVKPALVHTPRSWTFKPDGLPEFDAVMRDAKVLRAIKDKRFPAEFGEGVRMTLRLEVREVYVDGQWKLQRGGRSVTRVISPKID